MDSSPHLYVSEHEDSEDVHKEPDTSCDHINPPNPDVERDSFFCQYCKSYFTSRQGLEQHMHNHVFMDGEAHVFKSSSLTSSSTNSSTSASGDHSGQHHIPEILKEHHAYTYTEKIFTTKTDKQQHECIVHNDPPELMHDEQTKLKPEGVFQPSSSESPQHHSMHAEKTVSTSLLKDEQVYAEQYMSDLPNNISENLSFYIDGKLVSTSMVSSCEVAELHTGTSPLIGLDALIVDPVQISQVLNADTEIPSLLQAKRRTTTPPLLPQINSELESEVVVSSFSSSLVSSLIENLFPQSSESTVVQKERTVFLSPKLKQLLEKQEVLKPTLTLITDGQNSSSPVSLSVLPSGTGRFKRRTSSPTGLTHQISTSEETSEPNSEDFGSGIAQQIDSSPVPQMLNENDTTPAAAVQEVKAVLSESWPPVTGGNSCNQKPLDLSNTVKRNDDVTSDDAALDLSLQRKSPGESELTLDLVSQADLKGESNTCMVEKALVKTGEQKIDLGNPLTPLVTDFTFVTGSDVVGPLEHVAEGLVYGLAIPPNTLTSSAASLTPVALEPASPCTIAFASPVAHNVLPTSSVITVLASPSSISNPSSQPIQVLTPNLSHEPLIICTENALNSSDCDLTTAFASTNPASIITLSQPLDPTLNLPGHVFLTDQIALNPPVVESSPGTQVQFPSAVTLNDSLLNIARNTVLIECTISLEAPGSVVPPAVTVQDNAADPPVPTEMMVNHTEQQQTVSVSNPQTVDHAIFVSSVTESVALSSNTDAVSDSPTADDSNPDPQPVDSANPNPPTKNEEEAADSTVSTSDMPPTTSPPPTPLEKADDESSNNTGTDPQKQTFTKNFVCNVCDTLFHSMKELGHHVVNHADEWPYKCEFCVLLFGKPSDLLDHRSSLHGVGKTYVCSACTKEFVYLCNLKQHQEELHPGQQCSHTEEEKGKLRPQNYNNSTKVNSDPLVLKHLEEPKKLVKKEEGEVGVTADEVLSTIKTMASDGSKIKGPDVRLGINQHYPSFKPPPFPYHNRSPAGSLASATNFTTHNIPQTFSTAIRCTKCGKSFDNMPELHKHILACANASDKRRYTPRKNPIPLRHFAKTQNGVLSTTNSANGLNKVSQTSRSKLSQESPIKLKILKKRKKKLVQRVMPQRNKSVPSSNKMSPTQVAEPQEIFVCPHCSREFTMRRSRTKHAVVCPKKPKEIKKRKEGGISITKENDEHLQRGLSHVKEKKQSSPQHNTRLQTSISTKRSAILPVQTVFSSKRSKIIIKEGTQAKEEAPTFSDIPIRTFNPSMRQYSRVQHSIKGVPIKITIAKPRQSVPQKDEPPPTHSREEATGTKAGRSEQNVLA